MFKYLRKEGLCKMDNNLSLKDQINIKNSLGTDIFKKYCDTGIIIYYTYSYSNKQIQDL